MVGYVRRNFLVPVPRVESFEALNAHLEQRCLERMDATLRGHTETVDLQGDWAGDFHRHWAILGARWFHKYQVVVGWSITSFAAQQGVVWR